MSGAKPERLGARGWAAFYVANRLQVVPLIAGTKECNRKGWLTLVHKPEDFDPGDNLGIRTVGGLVDVDLDSPEAVALADAFLPETGMVHGRPAKPRSHRYFRSKLEKKVSFKDAETGKTIVEILVNHQSMAPPSIHPSGEEVRWDGRLSGADQAESDALLRAVRLLATACVVALYYPAEGARHEWALALAGTLRKVGLSEDEALKVVGEAAVLAGEDDIRDRLGAVTGTYQKPADGVVLGAKRLAQLWGKKHAETLKRIWAGGGGDAAVLQASLEPYIEEMNETYAVVRVGKDEVVLREEPDGRAVFQQRDDLSLRFCNRKVVVGTKADGSPELKTLDRAWLEHPKRRSFENVVFAPTGFDPAAVRYREGLDYNLWRGLAVEPDTGPNPEQRCARYLELLSDVVCDGQSEVLKFLMKLLAFKVQQPGRISEVVVFLLGKQGIGKGIAIRRGVLPLFRTENWTHVQNPDHILGKFNALLAEQVAVFIDEGIDPNNDRHVNALKLLATEDQITIERKGIDAIKAANFAQIFVATNKDHAWHTELEDRRALILKVNESRIGDTEFFGAVQKELGSGGLQAFLAVLLATPVTADELRKVPVTRAKVEHAQRDLDPVTSYYLDALYRETPLGAPPRDQDAADYEETAHRSSKDQKQSRHAGYTWWAVRVTMPRWWADFKASDQGRRFAAAGGTERSFQMKLAALVPKAWKSTSRERPRFYVLGPMQEARAHFVEVTGLKVAWDEDQPDLPLEAGE